MSEKKYAILPRGRYDGERTYLKMFKESRDLVHYWRWVEKGAFEGLVAIPTTSIVALRHELHMRLMVPHYRIYTVFDKATNAAIGSTSMAHVSLEHGRVEVCSTFFDPAFQGRGYAHDMRVATTKLAFEEWGMRMMYAFVYPHNERSIRYLTNIGFEEGPCFPDWSIVQGEPTDEIMFVLTRERYAGMQNKSSSAPPRKRAPRKTRTTKK